MTQGPAVNDIDDVDAPASRGRATGAKRWLARTVAALAVVLPLAAIPAVAEASPALAGCVRGEQVCLYNQAGSFVGAYSDTTDYWQPVYGGRVATARNLFGDNAVYFRHGTGSRAVTSCIQPQRRASVLIAGYPAVTGIMIRPGGNCYPGGVIR